VAKLAAGDAEVSWQNLTKMLRSSVSSLHNMRCRTYGYTEVTPILPRLIMRPRADLQYDDNRHSYVFGRPFAKRFALWYRTVVYHVLSVCRSVCDVRVLWPNGSVDQDATWYGGRPRSRRYCVRWGPSSTPPPKGALEPLTFRPMTIVAKRKRSPISATAGLL